VCDGGFVSALIEGENKRLHCGKDKLY
jgi:hypothetical protein